MISPVKAGSGKEGGIGQINNGVSSNLDGRLSALPPFDVSAGRRSTENQQLTFLLEKD